jgi:hypothetical protein
VSSLAASIGVLSNVVSANTNKSLEVENNVDTLTTVLAELQQQIDVINASVWSLQSKVATDVSIPLAGLPIGIITREEHIVQANSTLASVLANWADWINYLEILLVVPWAAGPPPDVERVTPIDFSHQREIVRGMGDTGVFSRLSFHQFKRVKVKLSYVTESISAAGQTLLSSSAPVFLPDSDISSSDVRLLSTSYTPYALGDINSGAFERSPPLYPFGDVKVHWQQMTEEYFKSIEQASILASDFVEEALAGQYAVLTDQTLKDYLGKAVHWATDVGERRPPASTYSSFDKDTGTFEELVWFDWGIFDYDGTGQGFPRTWDAHESTATIVHYVPPSENIVAIGLSMCETNWFRNYYMKVATFADMQTLFGSTPGVQELKFVSPPGVNAVAISYSLNPDSSNHVWSTPQVASYKDSFGVMQVQSGFSLILPDPIVTTSIL